MQPLDDWCAPDVCTLPLSAQPLRVADWDALFAGSVRVVRRMPGGVEFVLDAGSASAASVADLADRESQCCAFLEFALSVRNGSLKLAVTADADHADVAARAGRAR
jgi:hypothetical protein